MLNFAVAASSLPALIRLMGPTIPIPNLPLAVAVKTRVPAAIWVSTATPLLRVMVILRGTAGTGAVAPYLNQAALLAAGYLYVRLGPTSVFRPRSTDITDGTSNTIIIGETTSPTPVAPLPPGTLPTFLDPTSNPILFVQTA